MQYDVRCVDSIGRGSPPQKIRCLLRTAYCSLPTLSPASPLAFILCTLGRVFATVALALKRNRLAGILPETVTVRASVGAPVAAGRGRTHCGQSSQTHNQRQTKSQKNARSLHVMNSLQFAEVHCDLSVGYSLPVRGNRQVFQERIKGYS